MNRTYTVNGLNQFVAAGPAVFGYDANGNLTGDGTTSYVYDAENRLVSAAQVAGGATTANLRYDPLGRLYETSGAAGAASTTRFLYDGDALVGEYNDGGTLLRRYVHGTGTDTPYTWYEGSAVSATTRRHLFANEQGSISLVTDGTGFTVLGKNAYDAYGIPKGAATATPADDNIGRFQYTGQIWLPELGMYYYKARMMSPTLGRFMQTDPIGYDDGMNWYNYVGSDPVNYVDPTGLAGRCVFNDPNDSRKECEAAGGRWVEDDDGPADIVVNGLRAIRFGGGFGDGVIVVNGLSPKKEAPAPANPCPTVPSNRPIGSVGVAGATLRDPKGMLIAYDVRAAAHAATRSRFGKSGGDDSSDAYRHVFGAFALGRLIGRSRATAILNANEVENGAGRLASVRMDTYNNWVGTALSQDPRFWGKSSADAAKYALENGCLVTSP